MVILGIDPALTSLGWGIISLQGNKLEYINSGIIQNNNAKELITLRLAKIIVSIEEIIARYSPKIVAMEETFVNNNAHSSLKLGYVRGAIMATIGKCGLMFREFKPNLIKKTVVGNGHAEKEQILYMIKLLIPNAHHIVNFDEADALAAAYTASVVGSAHFSF